jgi:hypothetical protein
VDAVGRENVSAREDTVVLGCERELARDYRESDPEAILSVNDDGYGCGSGRRLRRSLS